MCLVSISAAVGVLFFGFRFERDMCTDEDRASGVSLLLICVTRDEIMQGRGPKPIIRYYNVIANHYTTLHHLTPRYLHHI